MTHPTRRNFNKLLAASAALSTFALPNIARASKPVVVVIGGGAGGATAARHIANDSKGAIEVILIEPARRYYSCFYSNLYLGGFRTYESLGHNYDRLAIDYGINVVHDWVAGINLSERTVRLSTNTDIKYDRLIVSPGIDLKYESVPGYSVENTARAPHAYKSGTQVQLLKAQVEAMKEGGVFLMIAPPSPYRCPPGPYERVSMIAHLLKQKNPRAKIIILDTKEKFSKQPLFQEGWNRYYPGMVEWLPPSISGPIQSCNFQNLSFETDLDTFKADAANIIPAQTAGKIAINAGLTDPSGWCPIEPDTMQSTVDENVYVIGDSSIAGAMPKSAFSANSQAKVVAHHIRANLLGKRTFPARYANTCWSLIAPNDSVKVGAAYKAGAEKIESQTTFISQNGEAKEVRKRTYEESASWYKNITTDMFG